MDPLKGLTLTATDRLSYIEAIASLKPLNIPLNVAVKEYVHALQKLPDGTTMREVVDQFLRRHPAHLPQKTVRSVVDEISLQKLKLAAANSTSRTC